VHFVDVMIRQAHPGPGVRPYRTFDRKMTDAETWQREEAIPYPVLVDDLEGAVHQVYGTLADPTYLLDSDGRVAYYNMWTHAPTVHEAIEVLLEQGGRGVVPGGIDHVMHLLATITDGWKGLRRGLPQSLIDIETAVPGFGIGPWLGYKFRPLLAPLTLRATPLPKPVRLGLAAGAVLATLLYVRRQE